MYTVVYFFPDTVYIRLSGREELKKKVVIVTDDDDDDDDKPNERKCTKEIGRSQENQCRLTSSAI